MLKELRKTTYNRLKYDKKTRNKKSQWKNKTYKINNKRNSIMKIQITEIKNILTELNRKYYVTGERISEFEANSI